MRHLSVYNFLSLNGCYKGLNGDISWHQHGAEENSFSEKSMEPGNTLLFGRITYEMMAGYWSSPAAFEQSPVVAEGMNKAEKIVFSTTLKNADWKNTQLIKENMVEEVRKLKQSTGKNMTILGSGSIITQLAEANLIDSYQIMIDPVAIKNGTPIFNNIQCDINLKLIDTKTFKSGVVLLNYAIE